MNEVAAGTASGFHILRLTQFFLRTCTVQDILNRLTTGGIQARLARGNIESLGDY